MAVLPSSTGERPLVLPESPEYDAARRAWNLHADLRPAAVWTARSVEDVQAAIAHARQSGYRVAAQTTGHFAQTLPALDDTLLLWVHIDEQVTVDPETRTARIPAGTQWGAVVEAVAPHGLAAMHGSSSSVGVTGYLLGGGLSFYARTHGLAVNHVRAFEAVTADGTHRRASASENPDLFYALRGGGGNFAVVTAVELALLPYAEVTAGALFFDIDDASAVLRAWRDWTLDAPESVTTTFRILRLPPAPEVPPQLQGGPVVCVDGVSLEPRDGEVLDRVLRGAASPILGAFAPLPSAEVLSLHGDPVLPTDAVGDGALLETLDDDAVDAFLEVAGAESDTPLLAAELRQLGGALSSPPHDAGARGHLEGSFVQFGAALIGVPASVAEAQQELDRYLAALEPWATGTHFATFAERRESLETAVPAEALAELRRIRKEIDPDDLLVGAQALDGKADPSEAA